MIAINAQFDLTLFEKEMKNIVAYSEGFLDGIQVGKSKFSEKFANLTIESLKQFIDSMAIVDPQMLSHVYEWYQNGSPEARLFEITYSVTGGGISINSTFSQSKSIANGATTPFYNKASIMEQGLPIVIKPNKNVLMFTDTSTGEQVFTKKPVTITSPGGPAAQGGYQAAWDAFFNNYFKQSFLQSSGLLNMLKSPKTFDQNLNSGKSQGRSKGLEVGYRWITTVGGNI